jgi:hypothetical protein
MFYVALASAFVVPAIVMALIYLRLDYQLRAEDKVDVRGFELVGNLAFSVLNDLVDDRPFGIRAPRMDGREADRREGRYRQGHPA